MIPIQRMKQNPCDINIARFTIYVVYYEIFLRVPDYCSGLVLHHAEALALYMCWGTIEFSAFGA